MNDTRQTNAWGKVRFSFIILDFCRFSHFTAFYLILSHSTSFNLIQPHSTPFFLIFLIFSHFPNDSCIPFYFQYLSWSQNVVQLPYAFSEPQDVDRRRRRSDASRRFGVRPTKLDRNLTLRKKSFAVSMFRALSNGVR